MGDKKVKFDENTKIIIVEEEKKNPDDAKELTTQAMMEYIDKAVKNAIEAPSISKNEKIKSKASFIIAILSFAISVGTFVFNYYQKEADVQQADISTKQFELSKKPIFICSIEEEELYTEEEYYGFYRSWLNKNDIKDFNRWLNEDKHLIIPYLNYKENESKIFWDAYDNNSVEILSDLSQGEYDNYKNEYVDYINGKKYISYSKWKETYNYKKLMISLKNTGANITDARLEVYTFIRYRLFFDNGFIYSFGVDTKGQIFNEFWNGDYSTLQYYNSGNGAFSIKYTQKYQMNSEEYKKANNLSKHLSVGEFYDLIGLDLNKIHAYYVIDNPVYFYISYLDNEQEKQTELYTFNLDSNSLNYKELQGSDVEIPDFTKDGFTDAYFEAKSLHTAEMFGYQNAQMRPIFANEDNYSYFDLAKEKIISDLKAIVDNYPTNNSKNTDN